MALLQISEPGHSPAPHQRRLAVGIDLGTTHSLVAAVRSGVAECLPDAKGRVLLPSVVRYPSGGGRQIGYDALEFLQHDAANTIASVKRFMGRSRIDIDAAHKLPFALEQADAHDAEARKESAGMLRIATAQGLKSPVEVSAEVLATLRQRAEDSFDDELYGAVITVPAYFDDAQRQATKDAARLAGIDVLRLINEPTAAAIAYGLDNASEGVYAVYDLGGGTFDISVLRLSKGVFEVLATGGDSALGGDDYDAALADWVLTQANCELIGAGDKGAVRVAARACKETLTANESAIFSASLTSGVLQLEVRREDFEQATQILTQRSVVAVRQVMRDAKLSPADVQGVVMVGGATRMPHVQAAVAAFFSQPPLINLNPDEVVALGAAIQANQLAGNADAQDLLLLDVIPLSLGIETMGGLVERIISRNETIPTAKGQDFTTFKDGQTALALHVVQGERDLVQDCRSLARFELRGIPPMTAGAARIRVTFTVDADGLLSVAAREQTSGVEARIDVKPSYGLSDDEIARMLQEGFSTAGEDMRARALAEARVDAERLLQAIASAVAADGDLLSDEARDNIHQSMDTLELARAGDDVAALESATHVLSAYTEHFAAQRMNRSIRDALAGRNIDTL